MRRQFQCYLPYDKYTAGIGLLCYAGGVPDTIEEEPEQEEEQEEDIPVVEEISATETEEGVCDVVINVRLQQPFVIRCYIW